MPLEANGWPAPQTRSKIGTADLIFFAAHKPSYITQLVSTRRWNCLEPVFSQASATQGPGSNEATGHSDQSKERR